MNHELAWVIEVDWIRPAKQLDNLPVPAQTLDGNIGAGPRARRTASSVDDVVRSLTETGFDLRARIWREAELAHETTPQAFLLVAKTTP